MRANRWWPSWKRLLAEYGAMVAVYFVVYYFTRELWVSFLAMLLALFIVLASRPRRGSPRDQHPASKEEGR